MYVFGFPFLLSQIYSSYIFGKLKFYICCLNYFLILVPCILFFSAILDPIIDDSRRILIIVFRQNGKLKIAYLNINQKPYV